MKIAVPDRLTTPQQGTRLIARHPRHRRQSPDGVRRHAWSGRPEPVSFDVQPSAKLRSAYRMQLIRADDPRHGPVRRLADMTPEEIEAIERRYGAKVRRGT